MDQSKQTSREGLRGFNQICRCFPLCRLRNAARQTIGSISMIFKTDSKAARILIVMYHH